MLRVTITKDHLSAFERSEVGATWTLYTYTDEGEPRRGPIHAEVYDDDDEHYYQIRVEGLSVEPADDELVTVWQSMGNHAGATSVKYHGHPEWEIG
jgi:hypothetical protein